MLTDYSTKNNPSVDRAIYLIMMVLYYISKKNRIIFIYQFVNFIRLVRPTNRRKGLIPPQRLHTVLYKRHLIRCWHCQSCRDSCLSTGLNLTSSGEVFSDEILWECAWPGRSTSRHGRSQKERGYLNQSAWGQWCQSSTAEVIAVTDTATANILYTFVIMCAIK